VAEGQRTGGRTLLPATGCGLLASTETHPAAEHCQSPDGLPVTLCPQLPFWLCLGLLPSMCLQPLVLSQCALRFSATGQSAEALLPPPVIWYSPPELDVVDLNQPWLTKQDVQLSAGLTLQAELLHVEPAHRCRVTRLCQLFYALPVALVCGTQPQLTAGTGCPSCPIADGRRTVLQNCPSGGRVSQCPTVPCLVRAALCRLLGLVGIEWHSMPCQPPFY